MLTLGTAKAQLLRKTAWRGVDLVVLTDMINEACEFIVNLTNPKDSLDRVGITVYGDMMTLPRNYAACLGITRNHVPLEIRNGWIEFVLNGPGETAYDDNTLCGEIVDLGDQFCCIREPYQVDSAGCRVKAYTDAQSGAESYEIILELYGLTTAGAEIRTSGASAIRSGEAIDIVGAAAVTTTATFGKLTQVVKPTTSGIVTMYAIDPTDSTEHLIARYAPSERLPQYRRYKVPTDPDGGTTWTAVALCRKRYIPAELDNDPLCIDNFNALVSAMLAINARDVNDRQAYKDFKAEALEHISKQAVKFRPAGQYPASMINDLDGMNKPFGGY